MNKTIWKLGVGLLAVAASPVGANYVREQWAIHQLTREKGQFDEGPQLPQDPATTARWKRFSALWQARSKRDVSQNIASFLTDPFPPLRIRAVRALGYLENSKAQPALRTILNRTKTEDDGYKQGGIPRVTLQLALGRMASHGLKGQAKVTRMVKEVGLNWSGLVALSRTVNEGERMRMRHTAGDEIIREVVDLLYTMGKRGEPIKLVAEKLTLVPAQKVQLQGASLNSLSESKLIIDYFCKLTVVQFDDGDLLDHLSTLGSSATIVILARLKEIKQNPQKYIGLRPVPGHPGSYVDKGNVSMVFRAAANTGDGRVLPYIEYFAQSNDIPTRRGATVALRMFKYPVLH